MTRRGALRRHLVTFAFGLVHGLAFAEALVVLSLAPALAWLAHCPFGSRAARALSLAIATMGLFWLMQRVG